MNRMGRGPIRLFGLALTGTIRGFSTCGSQQDAASQTPEPETYKPTEALEDRTRIHLDPLSTFAPRALQQETTTTPCFCSESTRSSMDPSKTNALHSLNQNQQHGEAKAGRS